MSQGLEQEDLSVHCRSLIEELCAHSEGGGYRSIGISGRFCNDYCLEGGVDSVDPFCLAFLVSAIFCRVVDS